MKLVFEGKLKPIIDKVFLLNDVIEAEKYILEGKQFEKVLLKINY